MKKFKNIGILVFIIIVGILAFYFVGSGFQKQGNAYISDFSVSEDGTEITIKMHVSNSVGYIRKVSEHQQAGERLYLDCYSAFGGISGSIGAKDEFKIKVSEETKVIALYRNANCYEEVLKKNELNEWQRVK